MASSRFSLLIGSTIFQESREASHREMRMANIATNAMDGAMPRSTIHTGSWSMDTRSTLLSDRRSAA